MIQSLQYLDQMASIPELVLSTLLNDLCECSSVKQDKDRPLFNHSDLARLSNLTSVELFNQPSEGNLQHE